MIVERQTISHLNALVGGSKILEEQICSSFRGCHATSLLKSVFFTRKVVWQPLIKVHNWAWDISTPTSRAKNEVSFVCVAQVVLTLIYFKAKSENGRIINYDIECTSHKVVPNILVLIDTPKLVKPTLMQFFSQ